MRDGRHHAGSIAGQENDRPGVSASLFGNCIVDGGERIRCAGILRYRIVVQIDHPRHGVEDHIFKDRSVFRSARMNLRLRRSGELNHFRVTSPFEVEHAFVAPAVLVVSDELAVGVRRQRCLSGSRQSEEHRCIAVRPDVR